MTFAAEEWMTRLILGFGPDVQVLAPASLVRSVQQAATAALAAYADLDG
jgi:predicted DNA-binding transcriptional regulator YafY